MLKVISKENCERCENVKNYLTQRGIEFDEEMAEDKGYKYWREVTLNILGATGFPFLIYKGDSPNRYINGSTEEIIEQINKWYPLEEQPDTTKIDYNWGFWGQPPEPKQE